MIHVQHSVNIVQYSVVQNFQMEAMGVQYIVHCASMVWFDVKSDQQPDCASIIHHLQTLPLFEVTCMHKDLQNKGKACARPLDSDSRKLNWRRTVSWAILNNSRSEVLVEQSCTTCTLFYSLYVELSLLCRFSRQIPL